MFCINLGYTWSINEEIELGGIVYASSGVNLPQFNLRDKPVNTTNIKIFDPQLYLSGLDAEDSPLPCSRLASYPWFPPDIEEYGGGENMTDWFERVRDSIIQTWTSDLPTDNDSISTLVQACINFQNDIGATHLVIPSPLIRENNGLANEMIWIDAGIEAASDIEKPLYATLAISDLCLREDGSEDNELIQTAVDQITARNEIDGVYFVLERYAPTSRRISNKNIAEAILTLSHLFGNEAEIDFFANYCGDFGLIALGAGATHFASNNTTKGRRLHLADYIRRGGGGTYPNFFSIACLSELRSKTDLERIRNEDLLRYITGDNSTFSETLFTALQNGDSVDTVPEWAETLNNVAEANNHYIELMTNTADRIATLPNAEKAKNIRRMLLDAYRNMMFLNELIENELLYENGDHLRVWRSAFDSYLEKYN